MPKKSDRSDHGSAMSDLMPDVSLEPEEKKSGTSQDQKSSTEEEQQSSTAEEVEATDVRDAKLDDDPSESGGELAVYPSQSPDLSEKLGLLVSQEVEEALDDAFLLMRMEHGKKVKKSLIVEAALRYLLNDFQRGDASDSEISRWMEQVAE